MTGNKNNDVLFKAAEEMAADITSLYQNNRAGRADLLEFMDANENFGIEIITLKNIHVIKERLTLWMSAYKQPGRVKIRLMLEHFKDKYPETCRLYRKFISDRHLEDSPSAWKLLDFILSEISRDITDYSESAIEGLIKRVSTETTLESAQTFSEFLKNVDIGGQALTKWNYAFESRENSGHIKEAYSLKEFLIMAYCVFNEEMWEKQCLIEKAVNSRAYANLWLFISLHFICALRVGDMKRLPAPELPYDRETVLRSISDGTFPKSDARALVEGLEIRLALKPMKPSKTSSHNKVPDLKLTVPESLKAPLGTIMAIALAHCPEIRTGDVFVSPSKNIRKARDFFGEQFAEVLGNRHFSALRSNKSYLQGIEAVSINDPGKPKGYMLAALARSHKSGIGSLAETTDIYLKDAKFGGYRPEFIIREMFERGICSFIPAVLLEMYAGNKYKLLPIRSQTMLITKLGLAAHQIEWMVDTAERVLVKSRAAVNSILQNPDRTPENIGDILQNIASGNAPGRQGECLCLMTAAGFPCPYPDRDSCIGCGYEIYTKAAMHTLMSEYVRLAGLKRTADKSDSWRYGKILEQAVLPAISEMLGALKLLYKDADNSEILDIVERGLDYADGNL